MGNINIVGIFVILKWYGIEDERRSFKLLLFWNSAEACREHLLHINGQRSSHDMLAWLIIAFVTVADWNSSLLSLQIA